MKTKRTSLTAAIAVKEAVSTTAAAVGATEYMGSAVNLRKSDWRLLRRVAESRVERRGGGRPSVSKVIEQLIDASRQSLEQEVP